MTLIEFFDRADINNIAGALAFAPHKLVLVGKGNKEMNQSVEDYRKILEARKSGTIIEPKKVTSYKIHSIYEMLMKIAEENEDCVFDLSGGDELFLVAVGMLYEKLGDRIQLHRIDARKNTVIDCDEKVSVVSTIPVELSVEEIVSIYGGRVVTDKEKKNGTYEWDFTEDFICDIKKMWDIFRVDSGEWNVHINGFDAMRDNFYSDADLHLEATKSEAKEYLDKQGVKFVLTRDMCMKLVNAGLIRNYGFDRETGRFSFDFKNDQVKRCLTKAGQLLEVYTAYVATELRRNDMDFFSDVLTGVYIDWDGKLENEDCADVYNEVDIILMKGVVPVFISCKAGFVKMDELYKLSSVAERFGGPYVKKVLLCAGLFDSKKNGEYIKARADEMGIRVIDDVDEMNLSEFRKELRMIWDN